MNLACGEGFVIVKIHTHMKLGKTELCSFSKFIKMPSGQAVGS